MLSCQWDFRASGGGDSTDVLCEHWGELLRLLRVANGLSHSVNIESDKRD